MKHRCLYPLLLLLPLFMAGCSTALPGREATEPLREYLIEWQAPAKAVIRPDAPVLQVTSTRASAGFGSSDMIYVRQPHMLQRYARHRWTDTPARMLDPLLVRAAEASGLFGAVAAPGAPVNGQLRLDTQLLHLQQRVQNGDSRIELAVRFSLVDVASSRQLAAETQRISVPAAAAPYDGVIATNQAVDQLLVRLAAWLSQHVR